LLLQLSFREIFYSYASSEPHISKLNQQVYSIIFHYDDNRDEGKGYTYTMPSSYTNRSRFTSHNLSYLILVVDVCPSIQQHLYNGGMPITRGKVKGRPSTLHHIDRHGYILLHLLIHTQTIAQGDTGLTVGGCPGHADSEEEVHLRPIVTRVISYSEKWKSWKL